MTQKKSLYEEDVMRKYRLCILVMTFFMFVSPCFGQSDRDKLIGTWRLVSIEGPAPTSGDRPVKDPTGLIIYDSTGHMAVQINMQPDRPKFKGETRIQGTPEEIRAAFINYTAYYGTYEVKEKEGIIIHRLENSVYNNEIGKDNIRYYDVVGNRVILTVPVIKDGKIAPKSASPRRLIWERVK
jgi:hypothetical protein